MGWLDVIAAWAYAQVLIAVIVAVILISRM
jgi:hypothetical protein